MAIIPKGCTATNTFTVPFSADEVDVLFVTYQQNNKTVIEKPIDSVTFSTEDEQNVLSVFLSQEDTINLQSNARIKIQIRARLKNSSVIKSNIIYTTTDEILKKEVI